MAIYHMRVKTFSRAKGQSATAAAAYRASDVIIDSTTGQVHDYSRKEGTDFKTIVTPENSPEWADDRSKLWSAAEESETRKNSTVAREFVIALPAELNENERIALATGFARELVNRHGFVADVAIHRPNREGDDRNHHAHILCTTRRLTAEGFGEKTRELDVKTSGEVEFWRARWAELANDHLSHAITPTAARIDHRSLKDQGITDRVAEPHYGHEVIGFERRTGQASERRKEFKASMSEIKQETRFIERLEEAEYSIYHELRKANLEKEYVESPDIKRFEIYAFKGLQKHEVGRFKEPELNVMVELKGDNRMRNITYIKTTDERFGDEPIYVYQKEAGLHTTPLCWSPSMSLDHQITYYERTPKEVQNASQLSIAERVLMAANENKIGAYNVANEYNAICIEANHANPIHVERHSYGDDPPNSPTTLFTFEDGSILKARVYEPCAVLDIGHDRGGSREIDI